MREQQKVIKKHREKWNEYVSHLERGATKPNPKTFIILKKL
jgi:hypothetical protein